MPTSRTRKRSQRIKRLSIRNSGDTTDLELIADSRYASVGRRALGWLVRVGSYGAKGDEQQYFIRDGFSGFGAGNEIYACAVAVAWAWIDPNSTKGKFKERISDWKVLRANRSDIE